MDSIRPKKRFGQNFLIDQSAVDSIIDLIRPRKENNILEIGPGTGVMTERLLKSGATVYAVEIDGELCALLSDKYQNQTNFFLYQCDFLKFDLRKLKKRSGSWKVIGNLPYNVATKIIFELLGYPSLFSTMFLMTQLEVAEKMVAPPNTSNYGRLSIALQRKAQISIKLKLGKDCFFPIPKVNSAILEIKPKTLNSRKDFEIQLSNLTHSAFSNRRKTISNSLKEFFSSDELVSLGLNPKDRAQNLSISSYERLADFLISKSTGRHNT